MDYGEAVQVLERSNEKFEFPVIVMNYPKAIKAFYLRVNDDGAATTSTCSTPCRVTRPASPGCAGSPPRPDAIRRVLH
jgi:hypothetical protein